MLPPTPQSMPPANTNATNIFQFNNSGANMNKMSDFNNNTNQLSPSQQNLHANSPHNTSADNMSQQGKLEEITKKKIGL